MKSLVKFITEGLKNEYKKWFKNVLSSQESLVENNKVKMLDVDVQNLNKPEKSFEYDDFVNDPIIKNIISNNKTGFVVTNQIIRNPKQYIQDEGRNFHSECMPYWYQDGNNIYMINLCIFDKEVAYIDNYVHIISIESSLAVNKSEDVNKAILNDFVKFIEKQGNFKGLSAKPKHSKMKASLIKIGFDKSEENDEILVYKI